MSIDSQIISNRARAELAAQIAQSGFEVNPDYISLTTSNPSDYVSGTGATYGSKLTASNGIQRLYWNGSSWEEYGEVVVSETYARIISRETVATISDLKAYDTTALNDGDKIQVSGYYTKNDGGGGIFIWNSSSTETENNGTIIKVTGVTTGRFKRLEQDFFNVKHFGAKGDGSTDDTSIFTSLLTASKPIFIPEGEYVVTTALAFTQSIYGVRGKSIINHQPTSDGIHGISLTSVNGGVIKDITLKNKGNTNSDYHTGSGIFLSGCTNSVIDGCIIEGNFNAGRVEPVAAVLNNAPIGMVDTGINITASSDRCFITNCIVRDGFRVGIRINSSNNCFATNNYIYDGYRGFMLSGEETDENSARYNVISNNYFNKCSQAGGKIERKCIKNVVRDNHFVDCLEIDCDGGSMICSVETEEASIIGNYIECPNIGAGHDYVFRIGTGVGQSEGQNGIIKDNIIKDCTGIPAIYVDTADNIIISGNEINGATTAVKSQNSNNVKITNNVIKDCTSRGIDFGGSSNTGILIQSNTILSCDIGIRALSGSLGNINRINILDNIVKDCTDDNILCNRLQYVNIRGNICSGGGVEDFTVQNCEEGFFERNMYTNFSFSSNTDLNVSSSNNIVV